MPVTAKLSKEFYDRLGERVANELVDWFNAVDTTYRADLREFNELNFARFDAKLEQRLAEFEARVDVKLAELEARFDVKLAALEARIDVKLAALDANMERRFAAQTRWLVASWVTILGAVIALWFRG
ncbi:MAG: hypothetical protein ACYC2K_14595 [Gemmatimonadales bacterium]